jgi:hypothetical protein
MADWGVSTEDRADSPIVPKHSLQILLTCPKARARVTGDVSRAKTGSRSKGGGRGGRDLAEIDSEAAGAWPTAPESSLVNGPR